MNPIVTVDTNDINSPNLHPTLRGVFNAELTMINTNKGTMRCRLMNTKTGEVVIRNLDLPMTTIVGDEIIVRVRD